MPDPDGTHHDAQLEFVIDGKKYGAILNPLKATRPAEIEKLANELADMMRNTVRNHFGLALTAQD